MNKIEYWEILESSHSFDGRKLEENLKQRLGELSESELKQFVELHDSCRRKCYTGKIAGFANLVFGGCAETLFANFSSWASLQRHGFFDQLTSSNPDATVDYLKQCSYVAKETIGLVGLEVALENFGDDFDCGQVSSVAIQGEKTAEEQYEKDFPSAFEAFSKTWLRDGAGAKWPYGSK